jgi:hypothetical protein
LRDKVAAYLNSLEGKRVDTTLRSSTASRDFADTSVALPLPRSA